MSRPAPAGAAPVTRHNDEIQRNRAAWDRKPGLQQVYRAFHRDIARHLPARPEGPVLELGSGIGAIKRVIPHCITSDIFPNPWLDRQENAYALSYGDNTLDTLILFDVWHHLRYPGTALKEFHRALRPGGRVILFEPAGSALGRIVYGLFHHEGMRANQPVSWEAPAGFDPAKLDYYSDQYCATRLFWQPARTRPLPGWEPPRVHTITSFTYWAEGGLSRSSLLPRLLFSAVRQFDRLAGHFPKLCAARLLIVLEKSRSDAPPA